jgi:hypothetical protein
MGLGPAPGRARTGCPGERRPASRTATFGGLRRFPEGPGRRLLSAPRSCTRRPFPSVSPGHGRSDACAGGQVGDSVDGTFDVGPPCTWGGGRAMRCAAAEARGDSTSCDVGLRASRTARIGPVGGPLRGPLRTRPTVRTPLPPRGGRAGGSFYLVRPYWMPFHPLGSDRGYLPPVSAR